MKFAHLVRKIFALTRSEDGQIMAEYGLILALVTTACVGGLILLAQAIPLPIETFVDAVSAGGS